MMPDAARGGALTFSTAGLHCFNRERRCARGAPREGRCLRARAAVADAERRLEEQKARHAAYAQQMHEATAADRAAVAEVEQELASRHEQELEAVQAQAREREQAHRAQLEEVRSEAQRAVAVAKEQAGADVAQVEAEAQRLAGEREARHRSRIEALEREAAAASQRHAAQLEALRRESGLAVDGEQRPSGEGSH